MGHAPRPEATLTAYVTALIRAKARRLVRSGAFSGPDEEDLRQELTVRLLERAQRYDPARASMHTFVDRVVASLAATLVRERRRQKNGTGRASVSIEIECDCGDGCATPLRELLQEADLHRRTGGTPDDPLARAERDEAVHAALAGLPQDLREIGTRLIRPPRTWPATWVSRATRSTRQSVRSARTSAPQVSTDSASFPTAAAATAYVTNRRCGDAAQDGVDHDHGRVPVRV